MPPGKKGEKPKPKALKTQRRINNVPLKTDKKSSSKASAPPRGARSGLRSRPSNDLAVYIEDNPESILRKPRASHKPRETSSAQVLRERPIPLSPNFPVETIESASSEEYQRVDHSAFEGLSHKETPSLLEETDLEELYYRKWGYLPPLSEEVTAIIDKIIANPDMAKEYTRIGPENKLFENGLDNRNVSLAASTDPDPKADYIQSLTLEDSFVETNEEKESHELLWTLDQAKCGDGSNEALFQRTFMMNLIARHHLIYNREITQKCILDFSVEETWTCAPMPTRAVVKKESFLTQSKPDLAICFRREALIPNDLWRDMPMATKRLACYESECEPGNTRAFHFLAIEAKNAMASPDNVVAKRQSLNNASQALHNMFAFCKDAGEEHENAFFDNVRFFSVVATVKGLLIRIHRAIRLTESKSFIVKERLDYPLGFVYKEYSSLREDNFDRQVVYNIFKKIMNGYGATELFPLLQGAANAIMVKLAKDPEGVILRGKSDFYRFGQTVTAASSRRHTPAASLAHSAMSIDVIDKPEALLESGTQTSTQTSGTKRKRKNTREPSVDDNLARHAYQRRRTMRQ